MIFLQALNGKTNSLSINMTGDMAHNDIFREERIYPVHGKEQY